MSSKLFLLVALAGCASYQIVPPAPLASGVQPLPVRYEKSRAMFFKSSGDDGAIARVFASGDVALATVAAPQAGLLASSDAGRTWTFARGPFDFREVLFTPGHLYARTPNRVFHSEDGGKTWDSDAVVSSDDRLDALALGPGGLVYTAGRNQLYLSADGARTWKPMKLPLPAEPAWRARSIVADQQHPQVIYVALRTEPQADLMARFRALLEYSSDEALSALKFVDAHQKGAVAWGPEGDGVYVTQDGGASWKKTALAVDAWLTAHDGALWAATAEPILMAGQLARRHPDLASAAELQMRGGGVSGPELRAALPYPGRDALLAGPAADALAFRSTDGGASWERVDRPPLPAALALRAAMENGGQDTAHVAAPSPPKKERPPQPPDNGLRPAPPAHDLAPSAHDLAPGAHDFASTAHDLAPFAQRYGGPRGAYRPPSGQRAPEATPRPMAPETLLTFLDPQRLVARFNGAIPVTGVRGDVAFAPPPPSWDAIVSLLVSESESEHEIAFGPGQTENTPFELWTLQGGTWTSGPLPPGSPRSIAAGNGAVYIVRRDGRAFRIAP